MVPLFGHTSEETAYTVDDYPYGFKLRTTIRYWLEQSQTHGFRFVSQTMNPKTARWNAPKRSTYSRFAAGMYLDDNGHVQWTGITEYTSAEYIKGLLLKHPELSVSTDFRAFAAARAMFVKGLSDGEIVFTINDVEKPESESAEDKAKHAAESLVWVEIEALLVHFAVAR